jgi:UDP-N-acetylglucosamine 2-epimerase (non-hydrolysing)
MKKPLAIMTVLGTRPEIIKLSPILPRLTEICERSIVVHSGQHYSYEMDSIFFEELQLPKADYLLKAGSAGAGPSVQTARMLAGLEPILQEEQPALVIVQGDTNTTLAGALAASKLHIPVLHLEAGCRSFNRAMPEEINRVIVDHISQLLLAPDQSALDNLKNEGCDQNADLYMVGSSGLEACMRAAQLAWQRPLLRELGLDQQPYLVLTLHRAENTTLETLPGLVETINDLAKDWPIVFPVHPRTKAALEKGRFQLSKGVIQLEPVGYLDMLHLVSQAKALLTDSGGLQEEAAVLNTPVMVLRNETEWSYLVKAGAALLVGNTYPETLYTLRHNLQPRWLEDMQNASIPMPPSVADATLNIIASFLAGNFAARQVPKENYAQI